MLTREDPIIERAKIRFQEVRRIIASAEAVKAEYYQLDGFLRQAFQLFPDAFSEPPASLLGSDQDGGVGQPGAGPPLKPGSEVSKTGQPKPPGVLTTKDFAAWVLKVYGRQHIRELVKRMRDEGWEGNPIDRIAIKTLFNIMSAHNGVFRNVGSNYWELAESLCPQPEQKQKAAG